MIPWLKRHFRLACTFLAAGDFRTRGRNTCGVRKGWFGIVKG